MPSPWFAIALVIFTITLVHHRFGFVCQFVWSNLWSYYHHYCWVLKLLPSMLFVCEIIVIYYWLILELSSIISKLLSTNLRVTTDWFQSHYHLHLLGYFGWWTQQPKIIGHFYTTRKTNDLLNLEIVQINFNPLSIGFASCVNNNTIKNLWAINVTKKPNYKVVDAQCLKCTWRSWKNKVLLGSLISTSRQDGHFSR